MFVGTDPARMGAKIRMFFFSSGGAVSPRPVTGRNLNLIWRHSNERCPLRPYKEAAASYETRIMGLGRGPWAGRRLFNVTVCQLVLTRGRWC